VKNDFQSLNGLWLRTVLATKNRLNPPLC